jgi:anti-anti-sigma factor
VKYDVKEIKDICVIELKGNLEGGEDTFEIKDEVAKQIAAGKRKFVIDFDKTRFVNSTGIGVVVACHKSVADAEGAMKVCSVSDKARRAFVVTGVWSLFSSYDNQDQAVGAFAG